MKRGRRSRATEADKSTAAATKKYLPDNDNPEYESSSIDESVYGEDFNSDGLYRDDEDRKRLHEMSELDREKIIAERFEQRKEEADIKRAEKEVR